MLQRLADEKNGVAATVGVWRFPLRPSTNDSYPYQWRFLAGKNHLFLWAMPFSMAMLNNQRVFVIFYTPYN
jgi:hypothetical protein